MTEALPLADLIACHECDLLQRVVPLPDGGTARCCRCHALLYRGHPFALDRALAFSLGALVLFVVGNMFPVVGLEVAGERIDTSLLGTVRSMYRDDMWLVATLMLMTTFVAPLLQILTMLAVLSSLRGQRVAWVAAMLRLWGASRQWAMVEVFFLGVLVSLVKLQSMAVVIPGIALWSFGGLMVLLTAATAAFDPHLIWRRLTTGP